ncbi:MAG: ABC transporter ATP-binding protein [Candidatus Lokiarchaeota archaeon]|nr:ABC transporter ATP-binding protein [Candidatus Lokiarchaeota archaeon]
MSETLLRLKDLKKDFGNFTAVDKINLDIYGGEVIGFVGPNGAGKTTVIKMIARLIKPTSGKIFVQNTKGELVDLNSKLNIFNYFGFLIDQPFFYKDTTPKEILKYLAKVQHYPKKDINERIDELLKKFNLFRWKDKKIKTFSKGMKQKLGIAQTLLMDPKIIILDEPQSGLDPKARIEIRKLLKELQLNGKTIFVASHLLHEISEICDKIALVNKGKIIAFNTIENLKRNLKTNIIECQLLEPIKDKNVIDMMIDLLCPYLDMNVTTELGIKPIVFNSNNYDLGIYFDGTKESMSEILDIITTKFRSEMKLVSFAQQRTSQLERIYTELLNEYDDNSSSIITSEGDNIAIAR